MNRKFKVIAGIQIAAFGLLAASALGLTSTLASAAHGDHAQGTVAATSITINPGIHLTNKPFKSN